MQYSIDDLINLLPIVFVIGWAMVLLLLDVFLLKKKRGWTAVLAAIGLAVALGLAARQYGTEELAFNGMVAIDQFSSFLQLLILGSGIVSIALTYNYMKERGSERGEYYVLMLFSISGAMLMASAADLIVIFLSLELLSIPLYIMSAFLHKNEGSEEAGLKYFLMGAFAGGFILYGVALVFGATATTNLSGVMAAIGAGVANPDFLLVGAGLILVGLGFKVAAVPFHMWTPDVYQGSPTPATAYMAVGAKVGGFAALLRIFITAFSAWENSIDLVPVIWGVAALTLIVGNFTAIAQKNVKRMLAFSSISHAGFILMALINFNNAEVFPIAVSSVLFYLLAFAITSFGSWAVVISLEKKKGKGLELEDYAGLGKKNPMLALAMLIFMLSFTGIPPTIGFAGKFVVFRAVIEGGFYWLALLGVLTSLVSAFYYLRIVRIMYMQDGDPDVKADFWVNAVTVVSAVLTVGLLFFSTPLFEMVSNSLIKLF
jgi:NADH-quinone oxidoreductase subunit N